MSTCGAARPAPFAARIVSTRSSQIAPELGCAELVGAHLAGPCRSVGWPIWTIASTVTSDDSDALSGSASRSRRPRAQRRAGCRARSPRSRRGRSASITSRRTTRPPTITGARAGSRPGTRSRSASGSAARSASTRSAAAREIRWPWMRAGSYSASPRSIAATVVTVPATPIARSDVESGEEACERAPRRPRARRRVGGSVARNRSVRRTHPACRLVANETPSGPPTSSSVEPPPMSTSSVSGVERAVGGDAAERRLGLLAAVEQPRRPAVALAEAVGGTRGRSRRRARRSSRPRARARPRAPRPRARSRRARRGRARSRRGGARGRRRRPPRVA